MYYRKIKGADNMKYINSNMGIKNKKIISDLVLRVLLLCCINTIFYTEPCYAGTDETISVQRAVPESIKINESENKKITDDKEIVDFINNYFNNNMDKYHVPGAAVSVVRGNNGVLCRGYGYSDLDEKSTIDPYNTRFPLCSISKLFTATVIMQLYEKGQLELDRNIEDYISPYKVINNFNKDITIRQLLTHSSGLDESSEIESKTTDKDNIKSQEYYMDCHPLIVVKEPGTVCRYSNEAYNVLGYIIERISGVSYEDYIQQNILEPLKMDKSSVRIYDESTIAEGYLYEDSYSAMPLSYQYTSGSSGIISTAKDMENFLKAYLNKGMINETEILKLKTCESMMDKQFSNTEDSAGMGFGFIRSNRNGVEIVKHEGALPGYTNTIFIVPQENIGISVLTNSLSALPFNFEQEFLDHYYPCDNEAYFNKIKSTSSYSSDLSRYSGVYRSYDGVSVTNIMKIGGINEDMVIKDNKDGTLTLNEYTSEKENIITTLVPCCENQFIREDGKGLFEFRTDSNGNVIYAFNDVSINSFEKIHFYERIEVIFTVMGVSALLLIVNIILIITAFIKKYNKNRIRLYTLNALSEFCFISGIIGLVYFLSAVSINNDFCSDKSIYAMLLILTSGAVISIISVILMLNSFFKINISWHDKIYYVLSTVTNLCVIYMLYYFNIFSYKVC